MLNKIDRGLKKKIDRNIEQTNKLKNMLNNTIEKFSTIIKNIQPPIRF